MKAHTTFIGVGVTAVLLVATVMFVRRARERDVATPTTRAGDSPALARLENEGGPTNPKEMTS